MRANMQWAPLALLFLATVVPSMAQTDAGAAAAGDVTFWDVGRTLELTCNISNPDKLAVVWSKNESLVSAQPELSARARLDGNKLVLPAKTHEDDFGNYSCAVGAAVQSWRVEGTPHAKMPANTNVVEGQKLKLTCRLIGKPYPPVAWFFSNDTSGTNTSWVPVKDALGERVVLADSEQRVTDGQLTLEAAALSDAGAFACAPVTRAGPAAGDGPGAAHTTLRVKDMYAALWPFLGICAEVFVLCAVILVYEKRRTKPEMEDSDTDTHDQKKS